MLKWRGDRNGHRQYCCVACWISQDIITAFNWLNDYHVQDNLFRLGALGIQSVENAIEALKQAQEKCSSASSKDDYEAKP